MPKGSKELTDLRKDEIVAACDKLYATASFGEITIKDIGRETSFTRTSIYNYFATKEEIFLALFAREYTRWGDALEEIGSRDAMTEREFAEAIAHSLEERQTMLKLLSMNLYDMECMSRASELAAFKFSYKRALELVKSALVKFFPYMGESEATDFVYSFFPFMFGIYPYTHTTEKQTEAMRRAGIVAPRCTVFDMVSGMTEKLLKAAKER